MISKGVEVVEGEWAPVVSKGVESGRSRVKRGRVGISGE